MTQTIIDQEAASLTSICKLLQIQDDKFSDNKLELVRKILEKLDTIDSEKIDASNPLYRFKSENISDSLAFPTEYQSCILGVDSDDELWSELSKYNDMLRQEYSRRREILLSRLNCTVESFKWKSGGTATAGGRNYESQLDQLIHQKYEQAQQLGLRLRPNVGLATLLAVREDRFDLMANIIVSSNRNPKFKRAFETNVDSKSSINKDLKRVIIPNVPDRGGRTNEIKPPPKETLSYQKRARGKPFRGRGRR